MTPPVMDELPDTRRSGLSPTLSVARPAHVRDVAGLARDGVAALAAAVRTRLRPVCPGWPPAQFAALVDDVVRFHERWDAPSRRP